VPPTGDGPSFTRETPDVRRQALIDATRRCMARDGVEGTTVRRICDEAGVSSGLLRHYFGSKDALMAATYEAMVHELAHASDELIADIAIDPRERLSRAVRITLEPPLVAPERRHASDELIADIAIDPRERLSRAVRITLEPPLVAPERRRVQVAFWDLVPRNAVIARAHDKLYGDYRIALAGVIAEVARADGVTVDARRVALALTALLDGLWLQMCLEPKLFTAAEAHAACLELLGLHLPSFRGG